jgi:hypothetical protein
MPRKPALFATTALAAALAAPGAPAWAGSRLVPGPLAGTAAVLGGLSAAGIGIAMMRNRACRRDPACAAQNGLRPLPARPPLPEGAVR